MPRSVFPLVSCLFLLTVDCPIFGRLTCDFSECSAFPFPFAGTRGLSKRSSLAFRLFSISLLSYSAFFGSGAPCAAPWFFFCALLGLPCLLLDGWSRAPFLDSRPFPTDDSVSYATTPCLGNDLVRSLCSLSFESAFGGVSRAPVVFLLSHYFLSQYFS